MVTAKIKISVNGAAIFSRRQLPPGFEWRLRSPQNTPLGDHAPQRSNSRLVHFPHASGGRHRVRGGGGGGCSPHILCKYNSCKIIYIYRSPMAVNRTTRDATRAQSNSDGSISSGVCGVAGSSWGGLTGHPLLRSCPIIWAICAVTQSGGQRVRRWEEIKGDGVNWICLSARTSEVQSAGEGKKISEGFKLARAVDCFVHKAQKLSWINSGCLDLKFEKVRDQLNFCSERRHSSACLLVYRFIICLLKLSSGVL